LQNIHRQELSTNSRSVTESKQAPDRNRLGIAFVNRIDLSGAQANYPKIDSSNRFLFLRAFIRAISELNSDQYKGCGSLVRLLNELMEAPFNRSISSLTETFLLLILLFYTFKRIRTRKS